MSVWVPGFVECLAMFDAAHCPDPVPTGYDVAAVYAGGSSATHAWSQAELDRVAHLLRLPVWVPTPGHENPEHVAGEFVVWLREHGVPNSQEAGHPVHV